MCQLPAGLFAPPLSAYMMYHKGSYAAYDLFTLMRLWVL